MADRLALKDPVSRAPRTFTVVASKELSVIGHQRKPRPAHLKALRTSVERLGFVTPLVAVERDGKYVVIDGQHRLRVGLELGMKEFPVLVVPEDLARKMMSLNVEQALNIRERSAIAVSIYREMLEESPDRAEDDADVVDAIETAHLVTLGIAYEKSGRLAGSAFEPILKKCDGFLDDLLSEAYEIRQGRAQKVLDAARAVKAVEESLKAGGAWHSMARYQIVAFANPTKRARKVADFDRTFAKFIAALEELEGAPQRVLGESVE
ncbi:MAG TPA: ParB N-terminal domain-containing protein [Acidimicrobiales bacterium]|nr:ParB N-terminal domain-containing protein [Acidimicrobiales bacterium]